MENGITNQRNLGVDLLRTVAMLMVICMHLLKQGGLLMAVNDRTPHVYVAWLLEVFCFCAVDVYAMISGYVGVTAEFRWSRIVKFWCQVFFYSITLTCVQQLVYPESLNMKLWWQRIFPISSGEYWYMTAYFLVFFFAPFLNAGCRQWKGKQLTRLIVGLLLLVVVLQPALKFYPFNFDQSGDVYMLGIGYSGFWLIILYLVGAWIRINEIDKRCKKEMAGLILIVSVLLTWLSVFFIPKLTLRRFGEVRYDGIFLTYISPTIFLAGACLLVLFAGMRLPERKALKKGIDFLASTSLGVYLIHTHPYFWNYYIPDSMKRAGEWSLVKMLGILFAAMLGIYAACAIVDWIRIRLFQVISKAAKRRIHF